MKIVAVSDMHNYLPVVPPCDLLLIAGDMTFFTKRDHHNEADWLNTSFGRWLSTVEAPHIVGVAGNHDTVFEDKPHLVRGDLAWTYLQDGGVVIDGVKIWGSPWQLPLNQWAFNATEDKLEQRWARIPDGTDIIITHSPPLGYGDQVFGNGPHFGSPSLLARICDIKPKLAVFGHIHSGRGQWTIGGTTLANVSMVDDDYLPYGRQLFEFELT